MNNHGLSDEIAWPVLRFGAPNCFYLRYDSPSQIDSLTPASVAVVQKMDYQFLIDSNGIRYDVADPRFIRPLSWLDRIMCTFSIRGRPVRWQCRKVGPISLDEFKALIRKDWEDYPTVAQAYDLDYFENMLDKATTHKEVIAIFGPDPDDAGEGALTE